MTRTVEVFYAKEDEWLTKSYWSMVEQLPLVVHDAVPLIVDDNLYLAVGYSDLVASTCNVVTVSVPELLQSNNKNTSSSQVW